MGCKKAKTVQNYVAQGVLQIFKTVEPHKTAQNLKINKILYFILRITLVTRRTLVRLRSNKTKAFAMILLGLSVLHLFFYPLKKGCKKLSFFCSPNFISKLQKYKFNTADFFNII